MNIKKLSALLLLFIGVIVLAACSNGGGTDQSETKEEPAKDDEETVETTVPYTNNFEMSLTTERDSDTEAVDETIDVIKNSNKVVLLDLGVASTFEALGLQDNVIALPKGENDSILGPELETYKDEKYVNLGGLKDPDFEKIAELDPEIIMIGGRQANKPSIEEFKKAAPNASIIYVSAQSDNYFEDIKEMTTFIGELYDKQSDAEALNKELDEKIEETKNLVSEKDKTMMFIQTNGGDLSLHGPGGRYDFLYNPIGFKSSEGDSEDKNASHGNQISFEYISKANPSMILVMDRGAAISNGEDATKVDVLKTDVTNNVDAVKDDNIFELNSVRWYLNSGGHASAIGQLEELQGFLNEVK